jgi:hypothetical protein
MTDIDVATDTTAAPDEWRTYDEFAHGIDTYRLPQVDLAGRSVRLSVAGSLGLELHFGASGRVLWSTGGDDADSDSVGWPTQPSPASDPYDAVRVREGVLFVNLPLESRDREALTVVWSERTGRAIVARSRIAPTRTPGTPQVTQSFWAATVDGVTASGPEPAESRDLIGKRNLYRYSPSHLYEHTYMSSQRYMWQCLQGVQRGHGDVDLSTVWKLDEGLYLFCFREFEIAVASVWLHDLGYALRTTGVFLGLNGAGAPEHSRAGGHIYPLGTVSYPDVHPV